MDGDSKQKDQSLMERKILLSTNNLSVGYTSDNTLFEKLNLSLSTGELVCFMGPNGIGKSTLVRTLAGLQDPLAGNLSDRNEKQIAVVLTDRITASHMTARELINYGRYPYLEWNIFLTDKDYEIINRSIDTVRIQSLLDKKLYELSDGQMQMVMIARALAQETPVLLLDEPTAHLDLNNRVEMMNLLRRLARIEGKAILVATHELDLALQTADLIWLSMPDKSIKTGVPEDLVLDGSLDKVFQLKGFDLKTGKVQHEPHRKVKIKLNGDGPMYLWTKNALERSGFDVDGASDIIVSIEENKWVLNNQHFSTIEMLLQTLKKEKD
jgi:iron complex transport system ATP-binding protein